jgi:hypothetical protein
MTDYRLDSAGFIYGGFFQKNDFEKILDAMIRCYFIITEKRIPLPGNDENGIRDILLDKFLKNDEYQNNDPILKRYFFDKETSENAGKADIRVLRLNAYVRNRDYFIIECKRLDEKNPNGKSGLNGKYIEEGIARFTSGKYQFFEDVAGMFGFVVADMDIAENIESINALLTDAFSDIDTQEPIKQKQIRADYDYTYFSEHRVDGKLRTLYHVMFDLFANIS